VISAAIFQPGLWYRVSRRHWPSLMTCVSSGTISREAETVVQTPMSTTSFRTIQRRNRFRRLQALPADGRGKK